MTKYDPITAAHLQEAALPLRIIRHQETCQKLNVSSAKLFDMVAKGQFPRPFSIVPGGRAVGWLEHEIDQWILQRKMQESGK